LPSAGSFFGEFTKRCRRIPSPAPAEPTRLWTFSSGYAARRAERLRLSGNCHSSSFQRLRRPPCGKAPPFRELPLLLFPAATPPAVRKGSAFPGIATPPLSGGYAADRLQRSRMFVVANRRIPLRLQRSRMLCPHRKEIHLLKRNVRTLSISTGWPLIKTGSNLHRRAASSASSLRGVYPLMHSTSSTDPSSSIITLTTTSP